MKKYAWILTVLAGIIILILIKDHGRISSSSTSVGTGAGIISNSDFSFITEPDEGIVPVLNMIGHARSSIDLTMYELEDRQIESSLVAAERRGVKVRVILSGGYQGASSTANQAAFAFLHANGVPVVWSPNYFALTHEKSLVIDGSQALIMTFNLTAQYYATSRDFGIFDNDPHDVGAIEAAFNDDWQGNRVAANNGDDLVWSPGSESAIVALIESARTSLDVYNEEMADMRIVKALIDAAERGVAVNVDMTDSSEWKYEFAELTTAGAHVRTYDADAPLYIHAKMIVADGKRAFVGSENFSASSLDDNRELGIMITDRAVIASLVATFNKDWKDAVPFSF